MSKAMAQFIFCLIVISLVTVVALFVHEQQTTKFGYPSAKVWLTVRAKSGEAPIEKMEAYGSGKAEPHPVCYTVQDVTGQALAFELAKASKVV